MSVVTTSEVVWVDFQVTAAGPNTLDGEVGTIISVPCCKSAIQDRDAAIDCGGIYRDMESIDQHLPEPGKRLISDRAMALVAALSETQKTKRAFHSAVVPTTTRDYPKNFSPWCELPKAHPNTGGGAIVKAKGQYSNSRIIVCSHMY